MLRVQKVSGPASARAGEQVTYRVARFNDDNPHACSTAPVSWLIKTPAGDALTHVAREGPELRFAIPESWAGQTAIVMPYLKAPSVAVAVRAAIAAPHATRGLRAPAAPRGVDVVKQGARYYAAVDGEPRFFLGSEVRYGDRRGLMNSSNPPGPRYEPAEYEAIHGAWAWYLLPTI